MSEIEGLGMITVSNMVGHLSCGAVNEPSRELSDVRTFTYQAFL